MLEMLLFPLLLTASVPEGDPVSSSSFLDREEQLLNVRLLPGYSAVVFASGLTGADGLAFSPLGQLLVSSESSGCIYSLDENGEAVVLASGLRNPEGIAVGSSGIVYVTEDVADGRLISITGSGQKLTLCSDMEYPEGVAVASDGRIFVTQSTLEGRSLPPILSSVSMLSSDSLVTLNSSLYLWSFSDLAINSSGTIYVCNELSGFGFITESVIMIDPDDGSSRVFCRDLHALEGICFSYGGNFPMYVVEEDTGGGSGRIVVIDEDGEAEVFACGFLNLEDIAVDPEGRIYVSQDTNGTIIRIEKL